MARSSPRTGDRCLQLSRSISAPLVLRLNKRGTACRSAGRKGAQKEPLNVSNRRTFSLTSGLVCMFAFDRQPRVHPVRLALGVISHIGIAQRRQFTGGVHRSVSGRAGAVDYDLRILVRQKRRGQFSHSIRGQVDRAWQMCMMKSYLRKRFYQQELIATINLLPQLLQRYCCHHNFLLAARLFAVHAGHTLLRNLS